MRPETHKKHWPRKNLGDLVNFLEERYPDGLSLAILSEELGVTKGSISNMFIKDDIKLSKAEAIARHYGYELKLFFPMKRYPEDYMPPVRIKEEYPNAGNLRGMYNYIRDSGMRLIDAARRCELTKKILADALSKGDIQISVLNKFLDGFEICVIWKFVKNGDEKEVRS